jgi:hypothetical protein
VKTRAYWIISLSLISIAIFLHLLALGQAANRVAVHEEMRNASDSQKQILEIKAIQFRQLSDVFVVSGWVTATAGLIGLIISRRKQEPVSPSIPAGLLALYLLLQFAVV